METFEKLMGWKLTLPSKAYGAFLFLAALALSPSRAAGGGAKPPGDDLPATTDSVRCPDCNDDGKADCPTCGGKGELARTCELCKGTGQRPCTVCRKDVQAGGSGVAPGRVVCESCGGKGEVGNQGKPCARCNGTGNYSCTTCGGKGSLTCRKVIYDKVCPTCRFVGKVVCPTCDGTTQVSPAVLAARRAAAKPAKSAALASTEAPASTRSTESRAAEKTETAEAVVAPQEFAARYAKLTKAHGDYLDIFADDMKPRIDPRRRETALAAKQLGAIEKGPGTLCAEVEAVVARLDNLRKRWTDLRRLFESELTSYSKVKEVWTTQEAKLSGLRGRLREEAEDELNHRLDVLIGISEKHSQALEREEPAWLGREMASIEALWPPLKKKSDARIDEATRAETAAKATKTKRDAEAALARAASKKPGARSTTAPATLTSGARRLAQREVESDGDEDTAEADADLPATEARSSVSSLRRAPAPPETSGAHPAAWALLGVGAGAGVFWLVSRSKKNRPEQDAPPEEA